MDSAISGVIDKKKVGGIYGHFFSDLPSEIKEKLSKKFRENKSLIEHEGNRNHVEEAAEKARKDAERKARGKTSPLSTHFQPVTGMSKMRKAMEDKKGFADPDVGTQSEAEMMEELYISARKVERAAIRLQRIRRAAILHRSVKSIWKRKYACIHIQRMMRGKLGRMYVELLEENGTGGGCTLPTSISQQEGQAYRISFPSIDLPLTRCVLPKIKRFLRNCFLQNIEKFFQRAVRVQKVLRMWLVKNRMAKLKASKKLLVWHLFGKSTTTFRLSRSRESFEAISRARFKTFIEGVLVEKVDIPASIKIQKRWRGAMGRKIAERKRYERRCQLLLQRVCRAFVHRIWAAQMAQAKLEIDSATAIQRIVRGRIDRVLVGYVRYARWYAEKFIPAVIKTQSVVRAFHAKSYVKRKILEIRVPTSVKMREKSTSTSRDAPLWKAAREKFIFNTAAVIQKNGGDYWPEPGIPH